MLMPLRYQKVVPRAKRITGKRYIDSCLKEKVDAVIEKLVSEGKFDTFVQEAYDLSISN